MNRKTSRIVSAIIAFAMIAIMIAGPLSINADAAKKSSTPTPAQYSAVFNATYYANKYPDLKAAFGTNEAKLFNHFINSGMKEGRQASEEFNVQAYKARYADLSAAFGDDLKKYYLHYVNSGKAEGRNGRPATATAPSNNNNNSNTPVVTTGNSYQDQVIALVNKDRAAYGLAPLTPTTQLMSGAQDRAGEIVVVFSHTRPDGTPCRTVLNKYGSPISYVGENIAAGYATPEIVEQGWMDSSGHRANILNPNYKHIGVGFVSTSSGYGTYWVQMFSN